jgi:hypothetical protein
MPIHFNDLDIIPELTGLSSALIVPCNMCPAVTVSIREKRPFMQFFRSLLKSPPFEKHLRDLQSRLRKEGVINRVFRSTLYHHWFLCMWTSGRRKKLEKHATQYDAVIVLGCKSATETVRQAVGPAGCRVIEGMEVAGIVNATLKFHLPCSLSFGDCKIIPLRE